MTVAGNPSGTFATMIPILKTNVSSVKPPWKTPDNTLSAHTLVNTLVACGHVPERMKNKKPMDIANTVMYEMNLLISLLISVSSFLV